MDQQQELQSKLEELLGSRNVYYQPPASVEMDIPGIRYNVSDIDTRYAGNSRYLSKTLYDIIVIDYEPDNPVIEKILALPYASFDRRYVADNLNHDVIKLYY